MSFFADKSEAFSKMGEALLKILLEFTDWTHKLSYDEAEKIELNKNEVLMRRLILLFNLES